MNEEYNFGVDKDGNFYRVEYVPVVRCKDCKHWDAFTQSCEELDGIFLPEWYCADGVKRETT